MNRYRRYIAPLIVLVLLIVVAAVMRSVESKPTANYLAASLQAKGDPNITVWVNTDSGVYHCPGTRWYGKTKEGTYMSQRKAQSAGYRPAYGNYCN